VSTPGDDQLRIGNAERENAERLLRGQASEGRLDADELADRLATVRGARTRADLQPAFADLPVDVPPAETTEAFAPYPGADPYGTADPYRSSSPYGAATPTGAEAVPTVSGEVTSRRRSDSVWDRLGRLGIGVVPLIWIAVVALNWIGHWRLWPLWIIAAAVTWWIPTWRRQQQRDDD